MPPTARLRHFKPFSDRASALALAILLSGCSTARPGAVDRARVGIAAQPRGDRATTVLDAGDPDADARPAEDGAVRSPDATDAAAAANPEYDVAGHRIHLEVTADACYVVDRTDAGIARAKLSLVPPCYLLLRRSPAATGSHGQPVGGVGQPLGWRYRHKGDVVVLAATGGPTPPSIWHGRESWQTHMHCGGRSQGIVLRRSNVSLSRALASGLTCAEVGMDEPSFWIWAHDDRCEPGLACADP